MGFTKIQNTYIGRDSSYSLQSSRVAGFNLETTECMQMTTVLGCAFSKSNSALEKDIHDVSLRVVTHSQTRKMKKMSKERTLKKVVKRGEIKKHDPKWAKGQVHG